MFYNFPGAPGNTGYQAQANPNPLTDPRFKIPGGAPWGNRPLLPNEKETFDKPFTPLLNPGQNVPMVQGFAGDIGNMAGMAGMSGMEGAQLAGGIIPKGGFNLFNPFNLKDNVNKTLNTGASPTTPAGQMINGMKRNRDQYEQLRRQGIL